MRPSGPDARSRKLDGARILHVEDERTYAYVVGLHLQKRGARVDTVRTARAALQVLDEREYDLALVDLILPDLNGLQVCHLAASLPTAPIVIALTACQSEEDEAAALRSGADDFIVKPSEIERLLARIEARLRRGGADRRHVVLSSPIRPEAWLNPRVCESETSSVVSADLYGRRVLLVVVEPGLAYECAYALCLAGAGAEFVTSAVDGHAHLGRGAPWDLVVVDDTLPEQGGELVLGAVRSCERWPAAIGFRSGPRRPRWAATVHEAGGTLLTHPFGEKQLLEACASAVRPRPRPRSWAFDPELGVIHGPVRPVRLTPTELGLFVYLRLDRRAKKPEVVAAQHLRRRDPAALSLVRAHVGNIERKFRLAGTEPPIVHGTAGYWVRDPY